MRVESSFEAADGGEALLANRQIRRRDGRQLVRQELLDEGAVVFAVNQEEAWQVADLVRNCGYECRRLLGEGATDSIPRQLGFQLVDGADDPATADMDPRQLVTLDRALSQEARTVAACRAFVRRRLRLTCRVRRGAQVGVLYDVLGAALAYRTMHENTRFSLVREDHASLRNAFEQGAFPDVRRLMESPMSSDASAALYELYLLHCDMLLSAIENSVTSGTTRRTIEAWMAAVNMEGCESACHALEEVLGVGHSPNVLQGWYEGQVAEMARSSFVAMDCAECRRQLEEILAVPVLDASASSGIRVVPLREMPDLLPDYRLDNVALGRLQGRLIQLGALAPSTVKESINAFQGALDKMVHGDIRGFRRDYDQAWEMFQAGEERWGHVLKLMEGADVAADDRRTILRDWLRTFDFQEKLRGPADRLLFPVDDEALR